MAQYIARTRQLTKTYHGTSAADHLDLRIPEGSIPGLLGPDGASKSMITGMLPGSVNRNSGSIRIDGIELSNHSCISVLKQVGSLIETPSYYGNLAAYENLQIGCIPRGSSYAETDRVLSTIRLDGRKKKQATDYSLGMKRRLGLANALLDPPKLVLLGELTNGLDPASIHEMREPTKNLPEQFGVTVMVSSHLLAEVEQTAGYIGIISRGRLIFQDVLFMLQARSTRQIYLRTLDGTGAAALPRENGELSALFRENGGRAALLLKGSNAADGFCCPAANGTRLPFPLDHMLAQISYILVNHGIDLYRAEEKRQNLEDIYLSIVKEAGL